MGRRGSGRVGERGAAVLICLAGGSGFPNGGAGPFAAAGGAISGGGGAWNSDRGRGPCAGARPAARATMRKRKSLIGSFHREQIQAEPALAQRKGENRRRAPLIYADDPLNVLIDPPLPAQLFLAHGMIRI